MDPAILEHRYQILRRDFEAGRIDAAAFVEAVDRLGFQDGQGRFWLPGIHSGAWYYYEEQSRRWLRAGPGDWPAPAPLAENKPKSKILPARPALISGLAGLLILAWLVWPVEGAPSRPEAMMTSPLPTPTLAPLMAYSEDETVSSISGSIVDLSSGRPGAGIRISIGETMVYSDEAGNFSLTGLKAGMYEIWPHLEGPATPAQGPVFVNLDGRSQAVVNLAYYSQAQPLPTDTPQAPATPTPAATPPPAATPLPAMLPTVGGTIGPGRPLALAGLGLVLIVIGAMLKVYPLRETALND